MSGAYRGAGPWPVYAMPKAPERAAVLKAANGQPWHFVAGFVPWLEENFHVWERFEREATKVYCTGRRHYSARTIGEFLRHETAVRETGKDFKVNNNRWPDMARLFLMVYPERTSFFETRGRNG